VFDQHVWVTDCADSSGVSPPLGSGLTSSVAADVSAADYLERLKVLRARCGLDNDVSSHTEGTSSEVMSVGITKCHTQTLQDVDGGVSGVSVLLTHHWN